MNHALNYLLYTFFIAMNRRNIRLVTECINWFKRQMDWNWIIYYGYEWKLMSVWFWSSSFKRPFAPLSCMWEFLFITVASWAWPVHCNHLCASVTCRIMCQPFKGQTIVENGINNQLSCSTAFVISSVIQKYNHHKQGIFVFLYIIWICSQAFIRSALHLAGFVTNDLRWCNFWMRKIKYILNNNI